MKSLSCSPDEFLVSQVLKQRELADNHKLPARRTWYRVPPREVSEYSQQWMRLH